MRKLFFILLFLLSNINLLAQVGIGTNNPDNSAMLEVNATDKGLLPPRVALTSTSSASPITSPATGLLVFNTATAGTAPNNVVPGYYYWSGSVWVKLMIPTDNAANVSGTVALANGGTGATTAAGAITNLGATTVGGNLFTLANPSAITFPRFNADNTVTALSAADFRTAIGVGTGNGTVTSVGLTIGTSGTDVNVSGSPVTGSGTITLNIPNASTTARGLVSTSAQTFEGTKTFRSAPVLSTANASQALFTDVNRNVISNAISGTGSVVMSNSATLSSPTLSTPKISTSGSAASTAGAGAMRYSTSSGGVLEYSNGIVWNTLTSTVTKALVIANKAGGLTIPNNTATAITTWNEISDNANAFDPSTGVFTAPRTGNYVFSFSYALTNAAYGSSGNTHIEAWMDHFTGSSWGGSKLRKQLLAAPVSVTTRAGAMINFVINLNAGESIRPVIWHNTGGDRSLINESQFNNISIVEL